MHPNFKIKLKNMKKLWFSVIMFLGLFSAQAQEAFDKNRIFADGFIGASDIGYRLGCGLHYGITPRISVGTNFYFQTRQALAIKIESPNYYNALVPEISADYHFGKLTKTDWYAGASVGYCFWLSNVSSGKTTKIIDGIPVEEIWQHSDSHRRGVVYNAHIGVRYFIYKNLGVQAQLNAGNVFAAQLGLTFKI